MKAIKRFKFLTSQQFAEPNSCFSLIWGKMYSDRRLLSDPLEGYSCPSLPKLSRDIVTTGSCFLTEFLPVAFNLQGCSFWYKLMNMNEETTGKGPHVTDVDRRERAHACPFKSLSFWSKKTLRDTLAETPCVCVCLCGDGWELSVPVVPNLFATTDLFHGRQFFHSWSEGDGFRVIQAHYIFCAICL